MSSALLRQFASYNALLCLLNPSDRILAAVSGGVDSMTLLFILLNQNYSTTAAHCNFALRGLESDGDEHLVTAFAQQNGIPCLVKRFDTAVFAEQNRLSIQMAARRLRYEWFAEMAAAQGFTKIAIAHNANDAVETFFVNLVRGAGVQGLTGIAPRQGRVVRPLMFAQRAQILDFARQSSIPFRTDSSNASVKYLRNQIRHLVLPALQGISPPFLDTMQNNLECLSQAAQVCRECADAVKSRVVSRRGDAVCIDAGKIDGRHLLFYLHAILAEYGFSGKTTGKIAAAMRGSGRVFHSPTHVLACSRGSLVVQARRRPESRTISIAKGDIGVPIALSAAETLMCREILPQDADFAQGRACAFLDCRRLQFPLILRHPREGDFFVPLGMRGRKKLSDFFIDQKFDLFQKRGQWLLCNGGDIAWVVVCRLDDRYKITPDTQKVLRVDFYNKS